MRIRGICRAHYYHSFFHQNNHFLHFQKPSKSHFQPRVGALETKNRNKRGAKEPYSTTIHFLSLLSEQDTVTDMMNLPQLWVSCLDDGT